MGSSFILHTPNPNSHYHPNPAYPYHPWPNSGVNTTNIYKSTTEERRNVTAQHAISNKAAQLCSAPSSSGGASPNIAIQDAKEGGKKRLKQCHQGTATAINDNSDSNKQVGSSGMVQATAATGSSKRQARPPMDHFEKLLEENCLNHTYRVKHKLRVCSMMKSFMMSRSLPRCMDVDEVPDEGDMTPFPREDMVMMIYGGSPLPGMHCTSDPSLGTPACCGWGSGNA
jgi:hypothetical protein